jgi:hypothetical protein
MAGARQDITERHVALPAGDVRLVQHADLAAAVAFDAQEPRREGP